MAFLTIIAQMYAYANVQVDLVAQYGRPDLGLEYYTAAEDLQQLAGLMAEGGGAVGGRSGSCIDTPIASVDMRMHGTVCRMPSCVSGHSIDVIGLSLQRR